MSRPASPASHVIRLAIEFGRTHLEKSAFGMAFRLAGVSMVPGKITFAVRPQSLFSSAAVLIKRHHRSL